MMKFFKPVSFLFVMIIFYTLFSFPAAAQKNLKLIISEQEFNRFFPLRDNFYSYKSFKTAIEDMALISLKIEKRGDWIYKITRTNKRTNIAKVIRQDKDWNETWAKAKTYQAIQIDYGAFCNSGNVQANKKELAAWLAHVAHETRNGINGQYNDGLMLLREVQTDSAYITKNNIYPATPGKKYYGRGPLQLSYNGNYGFASDCIFGDKNVLLTNPDLITSNPVISFETAIYFWMTPQSAKPSAHEVMTGKWTPSTTDIHKNDLPGFGMTINIINGKLECNKGDNNTAMLDRIGFYQYFLKKLNIADKGCACSCAKTTPFAD